MSVHDEIELRFASSPPCFVCSVDTDVDPSCALRGGAAVSTPATPRATCDWWCDETRDL
jgi:hypothetical protein